MQKKYGPHVEVRNINGRRIVNTDHRHAFIKNDEMEAAARAIIEKHQAMEQAKKSGISGDAVEAEREYKASVRALREATYRANPEVTPDKLKILPLPNREAATATIDNNMNILVFEAAKEKQYREFPKPYGGQGQGTGK